MFRLIFTLLLILIINSNIYAQNFEWAGAFNGWEKVFGYSIAVDNDGNVLITGGFMGTVDFDPGVGVYDLTSNSEEDVFITKQDKDGNFLWVKCFGGISANGHPANSDVGRSIVADKDGNVYVCGAFENTVDFDPGPGIYNVTSAGGNEIFIIKLDSAGEFVWVKTINYGIAYSLNIGIDGNICVTGEFSSIVDFDPGSGVLNLDSSEGNTFVLKMDTSGNLIWAKNFNNKMGGAVYKRNSITTDLYGNVLITGGFYLTVDFDPGPGVYNLTGHGNAPNFDIYVLKLDKDGNFIWVKNMGGSANVASYSISTDKDGNLYTTGRLIGTVDFDPGLGVYILSSVNQYSDIFISKLDVNGNYVWAKQMGGDGDDRGWSVTTDKYGNIYTTGWFAIEGDFDPGPGVYTLRPSLVSQGFADIFISKLDTNGDFVWALGIGDTNGYSYEGYSIFVDKNTNVYLTGIFVEPGDFDPGPGLIY